jgi:capsular exopolysaccharide synthesis family protein
VKPTKGPLPRTAKGPTAYEMFDETSPAATEFRRLYSRIRYRTRSGTMSPLIVTSAKHSEGKTTTASLLAITVAKFHQARVALVDMDLHRPRVHEMFECTRDARPGVAEVLMGTSAWRESITSARFDNLSLIFAGKRQKAPSSLFDAARLRTFFEDLRGNFDFVVVDTAPLIPVSDTMVAATEAAGVLYVLMAGQTPREVAVRAKALLDDVNARIVGVVVNNAEEVLPYYYDYKYYGYK